MNEWLFHLFAGLALLGAIGVVATPRHVLAGLLSLLGTCLSLGVLFVHLDAAFLGAVQVLVSAGALVVLWLFVIQLPGSGSPLSAPGRQWFTKAFAGLLVLLLVVGTLSTLRPLLAEGTWLPAPAASLPEDFGGYRNVGTILFTDFVVAFESLALVLLAALIGSMVLVTRSTD